MEIIKDNLEGTEIAGLLAAHLRNMHEISPPESVHALDLEKLKSPEISFWSCWENSELLGCGALKELRSNSGEIKSMRTAEAHRRKGVAAKILKHIIDIANKRGYKRLFLETGSQPEFEPARKLYERFGFEFCGPFEGYEEDPNSVFMAREL